MFKDKMQLVRDFILRHYKLIFPLILVICVAITVIIALQANSETHVDSIIDESATSEVSSVEEVGLNAPITEVPLILNEVPEIWTLVCTYYNAVALGDIDTIQSVCDHVTETELLRYTEMAKYIEYYPALEVYTQTGPEDGMTLVYVYYKVTFEGQEAEVPGLQGYYVCTDENGKLYLKRSEDFDAVDEYVMAVSSQDDVVELINRVEVEYSELLQNNPQIMQYLTELDTEVGKAVGEQLAKQNAESQESQEASETQQSTQTEGGENTVTEGETTNETQTQPTVQYAKASTTVNVRVSDSEKADKLGQVTAGTTLQILEQGVNGWTKINYNGKDGYIKSEYLELLESADSLTVIGTVTATTNINVRTQPSTDAERLGVLKGGATAELLANENGWCKIKYDGQVGYVNADYVQ